MNMIPLDTLKLARRLREAGMPAEQAEAVAEAEAEALSDFVRGNLATKSDFAELKQEIGELRTELHEEIGGLRTELRTEIGELRMELHAEIGGLRTELRTDNGGLRTELHKIRAEIYRALAFQAVAIIGITVTLMKFL